VNSSDFIKTLRARGYTVALGPDGRVTATGAQPKDPERAKAMLEEHQSGLKAILMVEEVFGGVLK
jgi:hypothetical protein